MGSHIFGWLSLLGVTYTLLLYLGNIFNPAQEEKRVNIHCSIGKITVITIAGHLLSQPLSGFNDNWVIWSGLGMYLIIIASGVVLLYLPESGGLRYHARSIHPALVVGLSVALVYHLLIFFDIL